MPKLKIKYPDASIGSSADSVAPIPDFTISNIRQHKDGSRGRLIANFDVTIAGWGTERGWCMAVRKDDGTAFVAPPSFKDATGKFKPRIFVSNRVRDAVLERLKEHLA